MVGVSAALIKSEVVKSALITDGFIMDLNAQQNMNKCSATVRERLFAVMR